ncbi:MAG: sigma-54 dependent transcriptional regulator [Oligoflexia bacterium]|nr:sigma-54 dependent transcriptional regulator [Oligoflexia bacterium]
MKILIVDDDELMRLTLKTVFKDEQISFATSFEEASNLLNKEVFAAAFLDIQLKTGTTGDGIDLLRRIRERDPYLPCVMISGLDDKPTIMKCLEIGAVDYVVKGAVSPEAYKYALYKSAAWRKNLSESNTGRLIKGLTPLGGINEIRGQSRAVTELKEVIRKIGKLPGPFLVLGATGTGKELVARALWSCYGDANRPFIAVNCASLPENLVESELFGYEKGAFTGALNTKTGLFEAANGGDIFLDEIGDLSIDLQAKFLRVLQEKKVRRLGSDKERPIDVRIIAATNVNLIDAVNENEFREDLFYRLNVHQLRLPTLSERTDDILDLLKFFLSVNDLSDVSFETGAKELLLNFNWPGNIRQLRSFAEYLRSHLNSQETVIKSEMVQNWLSYNQVRGKKTASTIGGFQPIADVQSALVGKKSLDVVSQIDGLLRSYVEAALQATQNNRSQAAKILGVSRQRLSNWLNEWGII